MFLETKCNIVNISELEIIGIIKRCPACYEISSSSSNRKKHIRIESVREKKVRNEKINNVVGKKNVDVEESGRVESRTRMDRLCSA